MLPSGSYVGRPCPKCAYVRTVNDADQPGGQCPRCGEAYGQADPDAARPRPVSAREIREAQSNATLAVLAHGSITLGLFFPVISMVIPIILIFTQGDDELVVDSAKEALNFYITFILMIIATLILVMIIGALASVLGAVAMIAYLVMPIIAMVKTGSEKELYVYPSIWHPLGNFT